MTPSGRFFMPGVRRRREKEKRMPSTSAYPTLMIAIWRAMLQLFADLLAAWPCPDQSPLNESRPPDSLPLGIAVAFWFVRGTNLRPQWLGA